MSKRVDESWMACHEIRKEVDEWMNGLSQDKKKSEWMDGLSQDEHGVSIQQ